MVEELLDRAQKTMHGAEILPLSNRRKKGKRIYYHPGTGEPTCLLPTDKYHEALFLRQGFTIEPPEKVTSQDVQPQVEQTVTVKAKRIKKDKNGKSICDTCGKACKNLKTHQRLTHSNKGG